MRSQSNSRNFRNKSIEGKRSTASSSRLALVVFRDKRKIRKLLKTVKPDDIRAKRVQIFHSLKKSRKERNRQQQQLNDVRTSL